jgi:hypothetical protein
MQQFITRHGEDVTGILCGWDRVLFRGTLMMLCMAEGMMRYLSRVGVLLKEFGEHGEAMTARLKEASLALAKKTNRPMQYLPSAQGRKEDIASAIALQDGIKKGLVCVLTCVEPCWSYEIHRSREEKKLILQPAYRKCLHIYHYWIDPYFGFMGGRIQTWFPFAIHLWINGREWLARRMDEKRLAYRRYDNSFPWIEDFPRAQKLMAGLGRTSWPTHLNRLAMLLNPAHASMFAACPLSYYWSAHQTEWATDLAFTSTQALARIYPQLVRGAMLTFDSRQVLRFLGHHNTQSSKREVLSDYRQRPEGVRIKHQVGANSIKMYDKGSILRVEGTINAPRAFTVYRTAARNQKKRMPMRKGVADLHARGQFSQKCNERYLDALASLDTSTRIEDLFAPICRPLKSRKVRALRPWAPQDQALLLAISDAGFEVDGMRNSDLLARLYPHHEKLSAQERRRLATSISHRIRILRAHRILRKLPRRHRYRLTANGRNIVTAILLAQRSTVQQLAKAAA